MKITNNADISLAIGVWLLHDEYDYNDDPNHISATKLMRPLKQIVMANRVPKENMEADLEDYVSRALGHSIHDSMEKAWTVNPGIKLKLLGYPDSVIERVLINPTKAELDAVEDPIPVYLEQRHARTFMGKNISGKFDQVTEGMVNDTKSTSAYGWMFGTRDEENTLQMSIYRWIDHAQDYQKITEDIGQVNYIFTDWQKFQAKSNPKYPQKRVESKQLPLLTLKETEDWVIKKLALIERYKDAPESAIPECTEEELWMSKPKFKYFSDPAKAKVSGARSTKNFDTLVEANQHKQNKGSKGVVVTVPGEVKRCGFCPIYDICEQKDRYFT